MDVLEERIEQLEMENRGLKTELRRKTDGDEDLENGEGGSERGDEGTFE